MLKLIFDDFGYDRETSKIILDLYHPDMGISVMVNRISLDEKKELLKNTYIKDIGLHIDLIEDIKVVSRNSIYTSIDAQIQSFVNLFGFMPYHIDFHQNQHKSPFVLIPLVRLMTKLSLLNLRPLTQFNNFSLKNVGASILDAYAKNILFHGKVVTELHTRSSVTLNYLHHADDKFLIPLHPGLIPQESDMIKEISSWI